jgi:hypothetical protein
MVTVEQSIEVDVPLLRARDGWRRFAEWVLVGNYRLLCDALSCERMTDGETVSFMELGSRRSRVIVRFDFDDASSPDPGEKQRLITTRLAQDLLYFREYLDKEFGTHQRRQAKPKGKASVDERAGRLRVTPDSLIERDRDDMYGSPHYQS